MNQNENRSDIPDKSVGATRKNQKVESQKIDAEQFDWDQPWLIQEPAGRPFSPGEFKKKQAL